MSWQMRTVSGDGRKVRARTVVAMVREEAHLRIVLGMDQVDVLLVDDVVEHLEVRGVTRGWHQVAGCRFRRA